MYIQQDATLHSLFYLETALHVSGDTITHHQERKQLYLQHLVFVTPLVFDGFYFKNKFEKLLHLVGFVIEIYHNARSQERLIRETRTGLSVGHGT
jgi:hypothetical protein